LDSTESLITLRSQFAITTGHIDRTAYADAPAASPQINVPNNSGTGLPPHNINNMMEEQIINAGFSLKKFRIDSRIILNRLKIPGDEYSDSGMSPVNPCK
jgi:hypothetical protein